MQKLLYLAEQPGPFDLQSQESREQHQFPYLMGEYSYQIFDLTSNDQLIPFQEPPMNVAKSVRTPDEKGSGAMI